MMKLAKVNYFENIYNYKRTLKTIETLKGEGKITDFEAMEKLKEVSCRTIIDLTVEARKIEKIYNNLKNKDSEKGKIYLNDIETISCYINNDLVNFKPYIYLYI